MFPGTVFYSFSVAVAPMSILPFAVFAIVVKLLDLLVHLTVEGLAVGMPMAALTLQVRERLSLLVDFLDQMIGLVQCKIEQF